MSDSVSGYDALRLLLAEALEIANLRVTNAAVAGLAVELLDRPGSSWGVRAAPLPGPPTNAPRRNGLTNVSGAIALAHATQMFDEDGAKAVHLVLMPAAYWAVAGA